MEYDKRFSNKDILKSKLNSCYFEIKIPLKRESPAFWNSASVYAKDFKHSPNNMNFEYKVNVTTEKTTFSAFTISMRALK